MARLAPLAEIRETVARLIPDDIDAIARCAFGPDGRVARWADIALTDLTGETDEYARIAVRDAGDGRPVREWRIDEAAIRRGLRAAIEAAVEVHEIDLAWAIAGHRNAPADPAMADRVIQFAVFGGDNEAYPTGAGVEA
jgi:hypothetical protein